MTIPDDAERLRTFLEWKEREPPYEQIGRVTVHSARLMFMLLELCINLGEDRDQVVKWGAAQSLKCLEGHGVDVSLLSRCRAALQTRHHFAHGVWLDAMHRGQAFIKHDRDKGTLSGPLLTEASVREWADDLYQLAEEVESLVQGTRR